MAVSKRLRYEILRRDNHTCRYCGGSAPDVKLTVDHVTPTALGGSDDPSNLVAACRDCNAGKSSVGPDAPLVADVAQDALRWAAVLALVASQDAAERGRRDFRRDEVDREWLSWSYGPERLVHPRPPDWQQSVDSFAAASITLDDFTDAMETSFRRQTVPTTDKWRYMCGILWNVARDRQNRASALIASGVEL